MTPGSTAIWMKAFAIVASFLIFVQLVLRQTTATKEAAQLTALSVSGSGSSRIGGSNGGGLGKAVANAAASIDLSWYPPAQTEINNLEAVINGTGVWGFIYNTSDTPDEKYGQYNWCHMPHVRKTEYVKLPDEYELRYVELVHRHHKRTPYAKNSFPIESYKWNCDERGTFYYEEFSASRNKPGKTYWEVYASSINPFVPAGWLGTCQFPQVTAQGLDDSWLHGVDLYGVYHDVLGFLPARDTVNSAEWHRKVKYRVTKNPITSHVAGMVVNGMWATTDPVPLSIQVPGVDSLEPEYPCPLGNDLHFGIKSPSNPVWAQHLAAAGPLYTILDNISGFPADDAVVHTLMDCYYDNLSARQCHNKPLPCKLVDGINSTTCVTQDIADAVYRLGHWEYSELYRDSKDSFVSNIARFGVWLAELAANLRAVINGESETIYFHNVANDCSVSSILSILQVDRMVWPGMGAEVLFELYEKKSKVEDARMLGAGAGESGWYVRVLWGGQVLKSSSPQFGVMDMVPVEKLLAYLDGLVGKNASLIKAKCSK
ncbi:histidine acid phosphatase-like protein [Colletotrichum incanum]|nr:histidine acid phosphatase-like protein [Colletotrichum incanum]